MRRTPARSSDYADWYVDCFVPDSDFPVNSYGPHSLEYAAALAVSVLSRESTGIASCTISRETIGQSPIVDPGER